jgi:hypothetical protein
MSVVENQGLISLSIEDGTGLITYQYNGQQHYISNPRPEAQYPQLIEGEGARPGIGIQGWLAVAADIKSSQGVIIQKYTFTNATSTRPLTTYRAYSFSPDSGSINGIYDYKGDFYTLEAAYQLDDMPALMPGMRHVASQNEAALFAEIDSWLEKFDDVINPSTKSSSTPGAATAITISAPSSYNLSNADVITNYTPKTDDPILIDLGSFDGAAGRLKIAKKSKRVSKLAK